jgi:hypothetical protein
MAMDVLSEIKAAEEKALETRRLAAIAAKDALKLAEQEHAEIADKELTAARRTALDKVDAAKASAKAELDKQQQKRLSDCDALKSAAGQRLERAAQVCMERILK